MRSPAPAAELSFHKLCARVVLSRLGLELDDDGAKSRANNECLLDPPFRELRSVEVGDPEVVRLCPLRELCPPQLIKG